MTQAPAQPHSTTTPATGIDSLPSEQRPQHIAVIMDGNGRWAIERNLPRIAGHRAGAKTARDVITECGKLGVKYLTLYSFSLENWKRPADEVGALMSLCVEMLLQEQEALIESNVRFTHIGRREGLPPEVVQALDRATEATRHCTGLTLVIALNYSSRAEITDAVRTICRNVRAGTLDPESVTEETIASRLYTKDIPDPDLLIRTAGEQRVSNYLLWQISYAEIHVSRKFWPEFGTEDLHEAMLDYAHRNRRFGGLDGTNTQ
jgi:undecaprenyl diphosphate synthase